MIKTSVICGLTVAALTYEPVIAATGGAFVGMVDETDSVAVGKIVECLQGTVATFPVSRIDELAPPALTPASRAMIFIAPEAVSMLSNEELLFVLYHEQGHIAYNHQNEMTALGFDMANKPEEMTDRHEIEADTYGFMHCNLTGEQCVEVLKKMLTLAMQTSQKMEGENDPEDIVKFLEFIADSDHFKKRVANLLSLVR